MTRLQAIDSNLYDVMGVSPDDSAQEIEAAFHRLIEGGGYRIGVPLRGQWLRAHQIKEAYETLGDPAKRRAYDESLKRASERPLRTAAPDNDPGLAAMLRLPDEEQPPPEPTFKSATRALGPGDGERESAPVGAIGLSNEDIDPHVDQPAALPGDREREQAPAEPIESGNDEIVPPVDQPPTAPEDDYSRNEVNYGSAKLWGGATATLALGSLLYFAWPSGAPQLPGTEIAPEPPAGAQQVNPAAPMTGQLAELPPAVQPDAPPAADGLGVSVETPAATETAVPAAAPTQVAVASETQTPTDTAAASGAEVASATVPALAPPSSGPTSTAAEAAAEPAPVLLPPLAQAPSPVPPGPAAAPPQVRTSVPVRPRAGAIHSSAQWLGGGPTHQDNRGGRHVGSVVVQFTVQADGRVSKCGPVRSSGNAGLDALTCRLFEQRARFKPARDAQGNPVASTAHARYEWGRRRRHRSLLSSIFR